MMTSEKHHLKLHYWSLFNSVFSDFISSRACAVFYKHVLFSEGSCDTEDCSNDAENTALRHRNKLDKVSQDRL